MTYNRNGCKIGCFYKVRKADKTGSANQVHNPKEESMKSEELLMKYPDLLVKVLKKNPELWTAAIVAAYARKKGCSEIKDIEAWLQLANKGKKSIKCDDTSINLTQAKRYFPSVFYPCKGEDDLIKKVIIASSYGRGQHIYEEKARMRNKKQNISKRGA